MKEGSDISWSLREPLGLKREEMGADKAPSGVAQVFIVCIGSIIMPIDFSQ